MSTLFDYIAQQHGDRQWGHILDAGTGAASMRWLRHLPAARLTAVTASDTMAKRVRDAVGALPDHARLVVGNWADETLLAGERFNVVLADYFVGAVDAFSAYQQDRLLHRLAGLCRDRFYLVGLEPYVLNKPSDEAGAIVWRIGRLRDAVLLLAGQQPYREYPEHWTRRHLEQAGLRIVDVRRFPIRYRARFIDGQLDMCDKRLPLIRDAALRAALGDQVRALREEAHEAEQRLGGLRHGFDYIITAEPAGR
ncbi:MAG: class I SAM-dependent methyltransferase [Algiphilus sp.]